MRNRSGNLTRGIKAGACIAGVLAAVLSIGTASSMAQSTERPKRGTNPIDSYLVSDIERINLSNGNMSLTLPLATLPPMAGGRLNFGISAIYNSKLWDSYNSQEVNSSQNPPTSYVVTTLQPSPLGAWRIGARFSLITSESRDEFNWQILETDPDAAFMEANPNWFKVLLEEPDGAQHELRPRDFPPYNSVNGMEREYLRGYYRHTPNSVGAPMRYYSQDGSYLWAVIYQSGQEIAWEVYQADGTRIIQFGNGDQRIIDTNGNTIRISLDTNPATGVTETRIQDEISGRYIKYIDFGLESRAEVQYQTVGGVWMTTDLTFGQTVVRGKKYTVENPFCPEKEEFLLDTPIEVLRTLKLPASEPGGVRLQFRFSYNSDQSHSVTHTWRPSCPGPLQPITMIASNGWGSLKEMETPKGARVEYAYSLDVFDEVPTAADATKEAISHKTILHDGASDQWNYDLANHSVTNPDGSTLSQLEHSAFEGKAGLVYRTTLSGKVVTERQWALMKFSGGNDESPSGKVTFNPVVAAEYTTLLEGGAPVKMSAKQFVYDFNGNLTQTAEYDWFDPADVNRDEKGVPTGVPQSATLLRTTTNGYHNQATLAAGATVYANRTIGSPPSPLILNAVKQTTTGPAQTRLSYDGLPFGSPPIKGNVTRLSRWESTKWLDTSHTYDNFGNLASTTDPKGNLVQYFYEDGTHALPTKVVVDPLNGTGQQTSSTAYDFATGLVTSVNDANGNSSTTDYTNQLMQTVDPFGRPGRVTDALGGITVTRYFDNTRNVEVWSDLRVAGDAILRSRTTTDQLGRVVLEETSEDGATYSISAQSVYRQSGRISFMSNPRRATFAATDGWTRTTRDLLGRMIEVASFSGSAIPPDSGTNSAWTGSVLTNYFANSTTVVDQAGKLRRSLVDGLGRLIRVDEPNVSNQLGPLNAPVQPTSYEYDVLGNLTKVKQGEAVQPPRMFSYDPLSRLVQAFNPESGTINYQYDDNGNLKKKTDNRGVITDYIYDGLNRVKTRTYSGPLPGGATPPVSYDYDAPGVANSKGRLTSVSSTVSSYTWGSYDALGRVLTGTQTTGGQAYTMSYGYDLAGNMTSETYPSNRVILMEYDAASRLAGVKKQGAANYYAGASASDLANRIGYTAHGAIATMKLGNGLWEHMNYNSRLQPEEIGLGTNSISSGVFKLNYTYGTTDNNGNVLTQKITMPGLSQSLFQTYSYDSLNRLEEARENEGTSFGFQHWKQRFIYDRYGNRNFDQSLGQTTPNVMGSNPTISQSNNRINILANPGYDYDAAGNLKSMPDATGNATMDYDGENRQVKFTSGAGAITTYSYDGDGHRVKRVTGGVTTIFVYNVAGQLIAEYDNVASPPSGSGGTSYLTTDHLGSTRVVTGQDQSVKGRYDYLPFGEALGAGMSGRTVQMGYDGPTGLRQKFTQKERDLESGLDYFLARYYSGLHGRFASADPGNAGANTRDPQSWHAYAYARNNPLLYVDVSGLYYDIYDKDGNFLGRVNTVEEINKLGYKFTGSENDGRKLNFEGGYYANFYEDKPVATDVSLSNTEKLIDEMQRRAPAMNQAIGIAAAVNLAPVVVMGGHALVTGGGGLTTLGLGGSGTSTLTASEFTVLWLASQLRFTATAAARYAVAGRWVSLQTLAQAILYGTRLADPQGAPGAVKIVDKIVVNGKEYTLEIIYRAADNTILHFLYK